MKNAICCNIYDIIKYLLNKDIDVNCCDNYPIKKFCDDIYYYRCDKRSELETLNILKLLIEKGADVYADNNYPIKMIVYQLQHNCLKYLVQKGIIIDFNDNEIMKYLTNISVFYNAQKEHFYQILKLFIDCGIDCSIEGERLLKESVTSGIAKAVELLIEKGIDPSCIEQEHILRALRNHAHDVIEILIKHDIDISFLNHHDFGKFNSDSMYKTCQLLYNNDIDPTVIIKLLMYKN